MPESVVITRADSHGGLPSTLRRTRSRSFSPLPAESPAPDSKKFRRYDALRDCPCTVSAPAQATRNGPIDLPVCQLRHDKGAGSGAMQERSAKVPRTREEGSCSGQFLAPRGACSVST